MCECDDGWEGDGYEGNCTDIDECADPGLNNCDINANCTNNNGSFSCECNEGYVGDGVNCFDFDECVYGDHECPNEYANCVNTMGTYTCECFDGFEMVMNGDEYVECRNMACDDVTCTDHATCFVGFDEVNQLR